MSPLRSSHLIEWEVLSNFRVAGASTLGVIIKLTERVFLAVGQWPYGRARAGVICREGEIEVSSKRSDSYWIHR